MFGLYTSPTRVPDFMPYVKPFLRPAVIMSILKRTNPVLSRFMDVHEEQIIRLLWNQDKEAITLLYDKYSSSLFGVAHRILQSEDLARDVLQDTFVKVWKNSCKYDPDKGSLFTWLLNITRRTAIDRLRARKRRSYVSEDDQQVKAEMLNMGHEGFNPNHIGVRNVVDGLDEKYRILIDLVYFQGYTHREVEDYLEIPLGTVKTRVRSALQQLKTIFQEYNVMIIFWLQACLFWLA
jgi:RNA polymerase sigma factor (sigma-70 family)